MRKLVNIRGTNGSGKTTIPLGMMALSQDWEQITFTTDAGIKSHLTLLHDLKWVMLGKYDGVKTGGMDTIKNTQTVKETLFKAIDDYEDYNILMEGILCSTVRSTYIDLFQDIRNEYGIEIVIVGLTTRLEEWRYG